jgi:hypothetical protein
MGGAPFNTGSCYSLEHLRYIVQKYNSDKAPRDQIKINANYSAEKIWDLIDSKMQAVCDTEQCWNARLKIGDDNDIFLPPPPEGGSYGWLSTLDIKRVLQQYMRIHDDFLALGPVAMDFCNETGNEVCNLDLHRAREMGKTKIGIVFNTDPSTKPGQHWICMYIDLTATDSRKWTINYFDSYGMAPLAPEIYRLITKYQSQNKHNFKLELNCSDVSGICTTSVRQQRKNTECGMYCINFIVERLTGKSWEYMVKNIETDESIHSKRPIFFRPM